MSTKKAIVFCLESGNRVTNLGDTFHCRQPPYYGSRLMPKQFECALKLDESHLKSLEESDSKFALYMDLSKEPDTLEKIAEIDVSDCKRDEENGNRKSFLLMLF